MCQPVVLNKHIFHFPPFFSSPLTLLPGLSPLSSLLSPLSSLLSSPLLSSPLLSRSAHLFRLCDGWVQLGAKSLSSFSRRETLLYLRVMERGSEGENGLQMLSRSEGEGGNEAAEGEETDLLTVNERPSFHSFLSGRAHQRHALLSFMEGKVVSTKFCFHLSFARSHTHSSARAHICTAHARSCTYCTQAGFALIPDCFGFCGGLIRLLFKLRAKPACVCVCWSETLCVEV